MSAVVGGTVPGPDDVRRKRRKRIGALMVLGVLVLASLPWWGRSLAFFRVQRVEVRGATFARPADIVARLGVDTLASVWDPVAPLERKVRAMTAVREAHVTRRLPSTLVVTIDEVLPIALVPGAKGLQAVDEAGRVLPIDPSVQALDLPVAERPDTAVLRLLADLRASLPSLFARISEARRVGRDEVVLQLMNVPVRAMLDVSVDRFLELSSVEADLERRRVHPVELDLRFKDQVIARLP
jgi:cell division protein FtsQ